MSTICNSPDTILIWSCITLCIIIECILFLYVIWTPAYISVSVLLSWLFILSQLCIYKPPVLCDKKSYDMRSGVAIAEFDIQTETNPTPRHIHCIVNIQASNMGDEHNQLQWLMSSYFDQRHKLCTAQVYMVWQILLAPVHTHQDTKLSTTHLCILAKWNSS